MRRLPLRIARMAKPRQKVLKKRLGLGAGPFDGLIRRIGSVTTAASLSVSLDSRCFDSMCTCSKDVVNIVKSESTVDSAWMPDDLLEFSFKSTKNKAMTSCSDG